MSEEKLELPVPVFPRIPDTFSEIFPNGIGPDATYSLVIAFCALADEVHLVFDILQDICGCLEIANSPQKSAYASKAEGE